jgi:hypothetical protein
MSNLFSRFKRLLPTYPLRVGDVLSVEGTAVVVQEIGGTTVRVIGEASVGQRVYFRHAEIVGLAPSLALLVVEE